VGTLIIKTGVIVDRKFSVVTTFNQKGYDQYGSKMIDTFLTNWPGTIDLYVYAEDCQINQVHDRLHVIDFHAAVPALVAFKSRYRDDDRANGRLATGPANKKGKQPGIGFRWDAMRFCHKVYAVCDHGKQRLSDVMFWMDADTVCHSPVTLDFINTNVPLDVSVAYLGRKYNFSECGLYALDLAQEATQQFLFRFQNYYDDAENQLFKEQEYNDCWVFDRCREQIQTQFPSWRQLNWSENFTKQQEGHPLINSVWGAVLDHLKGERKIYGFSGDRVTRNEDYWLSRSQVWESAK